VEQERYDINTVANWFLNKASMSHKKLQKLCYYAEAWHQALYNSPLLKDCHFEAWVHGPVCPDLYEQYKNYGWADILWLKNKPEIDPDTDEFLEIVYSTYGKFSGHQLEDITHNETPWIEARHGLEEWEPSNEIINPETMRKFYYSLYEKSQND
jgi:uncharacterized phage-associated protein